jgi:hypothetical protein
MVLVIPTQLYQCETRALQKAWIKRELMKGRVLSDSGLWLGGIDLPQVLIKSLRAEGLNVVTTTKKVIDAADAEHEDPAWCLGE